MVVSFHNISIQLKEKESIIWILVCPHHSSDASVTVPTVVDFTKSPLHARYAVVLLLVKIVLWIIIIGLYPKS